MDSRLTLLTVARLYCDATGRSLARVATLIHNQGALFKKLEAGDTCTIETYDKAMRWFSDHWPATAPWPDGIARPVRGAPDHAHQDDAAPDSGRAA